MEKAVGFLLFMGKLAAREHAEAAVQLSATAQAAACGQHTYMFCDHHNEANGLFHGTAVHGLGGV